MIIRKFSFLILSLTIFCCKVQNIKGMISEDVIGQIIKNDKLVYGYCREKLQSPVIKDVFKLIGKFYNTIIIYKLDEKRQFGECIQEMWNMQEKLTSKALSSLLGNNRDRIINIGEVAKNFESCDGYKTKLLRALLESIANTYGNLPVFFNWSNGHAKSAFHNYITGEVNIFSEDHKLEFYIRKLYILKYCLEYKGMALYFDAFISKKYVETNEVYKVLVRHIDYGLSAKIIEKKLRRITGENLKRLLAMEKN